MKVLFRHCAIALKSVFFHFLFFLGFFKAHDLFLGFKLALFLWRILYLCFLQEAYTPDRITKLYEGICNRFPKNEQYLTHLFMSYVRVRNYKMQQKTALSLYKEFQRNPYYFWNVMSIVMQVFFIFGFYFLLFLFI